MSRNLGMAESRDIFGGRFDDANSQSPCPTMWEKQNYLNTEVNIDTRLGYVLYFIIIYV